MEKKSKKPNKKSNGGKGQQQQQQQQQPPPTRSSLRLNPNQNTPTDSTSSNTLSTTNTSTATPASSTNVSSTTQLGDSELKRRGIDPTTGLQLETCICPDSTKCKKLMWRLAAINDESMFPYLPLSGDPPNPDTPNGQHITGYRKNVFKHLYAEVKGDVVEGLPKKQYVALLHFKPEIRKHLIATLNQSKKQFKWRVPVDVGYANGLDPSDLCNTPDINGEEGKTCFASPNQSLTDAKREIQEKERVYNEQQAAANPSTVQEDNDNSMSPVRKNPAARELDRLEREAAANPRAFALKYQQLIDNNLSLKEENKELQKEAANKDSKHTKELETQREALLDQMVMEGGLSRRSLMSDKYHDAKPWLSKYLFGRPWKEHKARGMACFGYLPEFNCNVSGEGDITLFEKYCMASMQSWRGDKQPTFAAIYNRSQSSISRYITEFMPLLGMAGAYMSELDLEMDGNILMEGIEGIELCKKENLLYIDEDGELKRNGVVQDLDKL